MHKKIIMTCMAIAAFAAFVVTPAASSATLTEKGTAVSVGTSITGKSSGLAIITAGELSFVCTNTHVHGTVTANASGTIAGEIPVGGLSLPGTATGEDCTSSLGPAKPTMTTKLCLHIAKGTDTGTMNGCGGTIKFALDVTNIGLTCKYQANNISGTIVTAPTVQPETAHAAARYSADTRSTADVDNSASTAGSAKAVGLKMSRLNNRPR